MKFDLKKFSKTNTYKWITLIASLCGIIGFIISLFNFNSIKNINNIQNGNYNSQQNINMEKDSEIGAINQYNNSKIIPKTEGEMKIENISYKAKSYIKDFYNYLNNRDFERLVGIYDKPFRENQNIKTYFSESRLNKFLNTIDGSLKPLEVSEVTEDRKDTDYVSRRGYKYFLKYEINNQVYKETWKMILVSRNGGKKFYVNSLFCETKNCGKMPFYN